MRKILRYLCILLAAALVFYAAKYLDEGPAKEEAPSLRQETQTRETNGEDVPATQSVSSQTVPEETAPSTEPVKEGSFLLSFVGDCTLGCRDSHSYIDIVVKTSSVIEKDMIYEVAEISAEKPVKINFLYFFMHPWSTRFDKFHAVGNDGSKLDLTFKSDGSFPNRKFVPSASWYDTESGLGVATVIKNIKGQKKPQRFLWDRTNYRKDYLCDYAYSTLKPGTVVVYEAKTGFFQQNKSAEWIAAADELFKKLSE